MSEILDFSPAPGAGKQPRAFDLSAGHVVLLDGNNLAARSYHAAHRRLTSADGVETGSLHLFCTSLSKFLRDIKPSRFVVCWDGGRSVHRERIYPAYKEARHVGREGEPPERQAYALIGEFLALTGIEQWHQPGVEADDLIAAAHRRTRDESPDIPISIMSSDKDLLQLLDEHTHQIRFSSYGTPTDVWDRQRVIDDLGYTPEQIPLVMALMGDPGDGVPGARGIGPVKAVKLLKAHDWDLDKVAASLPDGPMVHVSRQLVDLLGEHCCFVDTVPRYEPLTVMSPRAQARLELLTDFCARYQLRELWERVVIGDLWW